MKTVEIVYRYDGTDAAVRPLPANAEAARARLDAGSRAIAALLGEPTDGTGSARRVIPLDPGDLGLGPRGRGAPKQRPYAAILGCSDARVPIELVFNEGSNDLFVVRVAGNGLGPDALGSLKYAADHLSESLKLIVALGHSGCGAVSAAVDVFLEPRAYLEFAVKHSLRNILDRLLVAVQAAAMRLAAVHGPDVARRAGYRGALVEATVVANAALAAYSVQQEIRAAGHGLRAAYGVYLLEDHAVWAPRSDGPECSGLAWPPGDLAAFDRFADAVVRSERIVALLGS